MSQEYIIQTRAQKKAEARRAANAKRAETLSKKRDAETAREAEKPVTPYTVKTLAALNSSPLPTFKSPNQQNAEITFSPLVTPLRGNEWREFLGTPAQEKVGRRKIDLCDDELPNTPSTFWASPSPAAPNATVLINTIKELGDYLQNISTADNFDVNEVIVKATEAQKNVSAEAEKIAEKHTALKDKYHDFLEKINTFLFTLKGSMQQELSGQKDVIDTFLADISSRATLKAGI